MAIMQQANRMGADYQVNGEAGKYYLSETGKYSYRRLTVTRDCAEAMAKITEKNQFASAVRFDLDKAQREGNPELFINNRVQTQRLRAERTPKKRSHRHDSNAQAR